MAQMALLESMSCPVILMLWVILFLPTLEWWILFSPCPFSFLPILSLFFQSLTLLSLNCNLLSISMKSLVWLAGNLKLEATNYLRELYSLGRVVYPGNGDDDDDGGEEENLEAIPSYQPRKRRHHWLPTVQDIYATQLFFFFSLFFCFLLLMFFISFSKHLD